MGLRYKPTAIYSEAFRSIRAKQDWCMTDLGSTLHRIQPEAATNHTAVLTEAVSIAIAC